MFRDYLKILLILIVVFILFSSGYYLYWKSCVEKADILYAAGKMEEAEKMLSYNLEVFPGFLPGKENAYLKLGEIYYQRGELQKAERFFHQALNINASLALPLYRLGIIRDNEKRYSDAIFYYEEALKVKFTDNVISLSVKERLAAVLYRYGLQHQIYSDIETANKCYRRILEIYPEFPEALHGMGSLLASQKRYDQAWEMYNKALEMNPDLAILYKDVSDLLIKRGKMKDAKLYKEKYNMLIKEMITTSEQEVLRDNTN